MAVPEKKHTLEDHLMGEDGLHVHEGESDHDHDHDHDDFGAFDPETDGLWLQDEAGRSQVSRLPFYVVGGGWARSAAAGSRLARSQNGTRHRDRECGNSAKRRVRARPRFCLRRSNICRADSQRPPLSAGCREATAR